VCFDAEVPGLVVATQNFQSAAGMCGVSQDLDVGDGFGCLVALFLVNLQANAVRLGEQDGCGMVDFGESSKVGLTGICGIIRITSRSSVNWFWRLGKRRNNTMSQLWKSPVRLATLAVVLAAAWAFVAQAQAPTPPFAEFQYAALTGSGNTITATQVPVVLASGVTVYENVTLQFNSDANGNLTLASGFPQVIPAPTLLSSSFKAGNFVGPSTLLSGKAFVTVNGPGVTDGGATEWSLSATAGADGCTYPSSATWYVGPIATNPLAARLKTAGITSTAWSYGVGGTTQCNQGGYSWSPNTLIGVSQIGKALTIVSFTANGPNGTDKSVPVDQLTFTLTP
jgi:hypothetical protein